VSIWDGGRPDQPEEEREAEWGGDAPGAWRGVVHFEEWPEHAYAKAEYGLFQRDLREGR
jgi:hypothetical protein